MDSPVYGGIIDYILRGDEAQLGPRGTLLFELHFFSRVNGCEAEVGLGGSVYPLARVWLKIQRGGVGGGEGSVLLTRE